MNLLKDEKAIQRSYFRAAIQSGYAKQIAQMKANRQFKPAKSDKKPYEPGSIGLSAVSAAIRIERGGFQFQPRSNRRGYARYFRVPFSAHYNGDGPVRVPHKIKPSKYAGARRTVRG